jgi:hypothetical protein
VIIHLRSQPVVGGGLVGVEEDRVALCDVDLEAMDRPGLDEGGVGFDDGERVVVNGELEFAKCACVDEPEAVGLVLFNGNDGAGGVIVADVAAVGTIGGAVETRVVSLLSM